MAGHSQFANIKHRKEAQDSKRTKIFTKVVREIICAAKSGLPDPSLNAKLKIAILKAKSVNLPKDRIESAIEKVRSGNDVSNYEEIRYNAFWLDGVAIVIEALTDNRNRSVNDIRHTITKNEGNLVETGSVEFMFDHIGQILYKKEIASEDKIFDLLSNLNILNLDWNDEYYIIETKFTEFHSVNNELIKLLNKEPESSEIIWKAKEMIQLDETKILALRKLVSTLEEIDDVNNVFLNV